MNPQDNIAGAIIAGISGILTATLPPIIAEIFRRLKKRSVRVPTVFEPWRWLTIVSFVAGLTALVVTLWPRESAVFINQIRADAKESRRLVGQLERDAQAWSTVPQRLAALEAGDFTPINGQQFDVSLSTDAQTVNGPISNIPENAHQLLIRFWISTGKEVPDPKVANTLTLAVFGPSNAELKFPFFIRPFNQEAIAYYSQFVWIPVPKNLNIYTKLDHRIVQSHSCCRAGIDIIGWR